MGPWIPGDIDHDGQVRSYDLFILAAAYGSHGPPNASPNWNPHADLDEDNDVDNDDLAILVAHYGESFWDPQGVDRLIPLKIAWRIAQLRYPNFTAPIPIEG